jgi:diguanylate cyclase (GGDEF)-like protein/PAS domain S-box-containing protein
MSIHKKTKPRRRKSKKIQYAEEERFKSIYEHINFGIALLSPDMRILDLNPMMKKWFPHIDVTQQPFCYNSFNTPPRGKVCPYCPTIKVFQTGKIHVGDTETPTPEGIRNYQITAIPMKDDNSDVYAVIELVEDITERKQAEIILRNSERFLNTVFGNINDPFNILDRDYRIIKANEAYAKMRGKSLEQLIGQRCYEVLQNRDSVCEGCVVEKTFGSGKPLIKEKLLSLPSGIKRWVEIYTYPLFDEEGSVSNIIEYTRDITERKNIEEERSLLLNELRYLSRIDDLTGLLNRRTVIEKLGEEVRRSQRYGSELTLMICDIDYFKKINDTHGHIVGDRILQIIANLFNESLRSTDIIGRYGGDEFLLILPETTIDGAKEIAERIRLSAEDFELQIEGKQTVKFTISLGIAKFNIDEEDINDLIKRTDNALYSAKGAGRNRVYIIE